MSWFSDLPLNAGADEAGWQRAEQAVADLLAAQRTVTREQASSVAKVDFEEAGLGGMMAFLYQNSPYKTLNPHFPDLQPWKMHKRPCGCWIGEEGRQNAQQAFVKFLSERGIAREQATHLRQHDFSGKVRRAMEDVYHNRPYEALPPHFPDLQPWEMSEAPQGYWQGPEGREHAREATRWLLERVQGYTSLRDFYRHKLGYMLHQVYQDSVKRALEDAGS